MSFAVVVIWAGSQIRDRRVASVIDSKKKVAFEVTGLRKLAGALCVMVASTGVCSQAAKKKTKSPAHPAVAAKPAAHGKGKASAHPAHAVAAKGKAPHTSAKGAKSSKAVKAVPTVESRRLSSAFVASATLRPMAQQLVQLRTPAAYSGVAAYAAAHPGEGAAAAQLALGHAYALDHRFPEAQAAYQRAGSSGEALKDYADYLAAQAAIAGNRAGDAVPLLTRFSKRYPESIFAAGAPVLLANAYLQQNNAQGALAILTPLASSAAANRTDVRLAMAKAYQAHGDTSSAANLYRGLYLKNPLSLEAGTARAQLQAMGIGLTVGERKQHADALFNAKHYAEAQAEYLALKKSDAGLSQGDRDALDIYAAVCDLRLKRLTGKEVDRLPVTSDDSAALKLYLRSELARNANDFDAHDALIAEMMQKYPHSRWLEEALYSGGNMYLIKHDAVRAINDYRMLTEEFPTSTYAPSAHWRAAWQSYRLRRYPDAARMMDEQIVQYPAGTEIPAALYWRGRLYEDVEKNQAQALNYYAALNASYVNTYYAILARQRTAAIGQRASVAAAPALASVRHVDLPQLSADLPEDDPHLIKARLLANAALNEFIAPEIQASSTAAQWGALAQAEIYQSYGENTRAVQTMKHSNLPFLSLPVGTVPHVYWSLLFPRPYWDQLSADAQANGLDPYLVASLIRQESEFNAGAVSKANAYGLMQLLPSVGKALAKREGVKGFTANSLLNPMTNLQLGTRDLRQSLDRYNGTVEYALASYNAGDTPVHNWIAVGDYKDVPEWVESIPYTETREYVQAIIRNREMYRAIYGGK